MTSIPLFLEFSLPKSLSFLLLMMAFRVPANTRKLLRLAKIPRRWVIIIMQPQLEIIESPKTHSGGIGRKRSVGLAPEDRMRFSCLLNKARQAATFASNRKKNNLAASA